MIREIVLDTETTGLDPKHGHRLVEIGAIELINHIPSARDPFHIYINPERSMPEDAYAVHGISEEFLKDKPVFPEVAQDFLDFIDDSPLVIHNAAFDMKFINYELSVAGRDEIPMSRAIDTVAMARKKFPGSPANLDALCKRFNVDNTGRTLHGALIDADLLAGVYIELLGGRQQGLGFQGVAPGVTAGKQGQLKTRDKPYRDPRVFTVSEAEKQRHAAFIAEKLSDPLWLKGVSDPKE